MGTTPTLQDRLDSDSCPEQSSNCDLHPPPSSLSPLFRANVPPSYTLESTCPAFSRLSYLTPSSGPIA